MSIKTRNQRLALFHHDPLRDDAALEIARAERPDLRDVPVVLLTAQAGGTDYVTKPFKPAHIRSRVHTWLRRKRAGREGT